jgi:hypothetical protein
VSDNFSKYDEFVKRMEDKYPKMFAQPYGGFAVGEGWWPILQALCANIQHYLNWKNREGEVVPQVVVAQIKEKFGGLRFYYDGGDDRVQGMVSMAESWADKSCEECGAPGTSGGQGWIRTLCPTHRAEADARYAERFKDL